MLPLNEEWRPIPGYEGMYEVSSLGRVKSLPRYIHGIKSRHSKELILSPGITNKYRRVSLTKDGVTRCIKVARLVGYAFIPNPDNKPAIDHLDTNTLNDCVDNLRWVTFKENSNNPITRAHLKLSNRGRVVSDEERKRMSEFRKKYPIPHTEEGKKKASLARRRPIVQLDANGNFLRVWDSQISVCEYYGYRNSRLCELIKLKKLCKNGFRWIKESDYNESIQI